MIQDLRKQLERKGFGDISDVSRRRVCIKELDAENKELGMEIDKQTEAGAEKKDPLPNPSLESSLCTSHFPVSCPFPSI